MSLLYILHKKLDITKLSHFSKLYYHTTSGFCNMWC